MKNKIIGLVLFPLLHIRWSFLLISPLCIYIWLTEDNKEAPFVVLFMFTFIWGLFFGVIFGNFEAMIPITKWLLKIFHVEYIAKGHWMDSKLHSMSVWDYPLIEIKGKEYRLTLASMGSNLYNIDANLRRKILFIWLFN